MLQVKRESVLREVGARLEKALAVGYSALNVQDARLPAFISLALVIHLTRFPETFEALAEYY